MMSWVDTGYLYPYIILFVLLVQLFVQLCSEMDQGSDLPEKYSPSSPSFCHLVSQLVWFFSLITLWCNGQLCWHYCDGNKWTGKLCGGRATPTLLAWLLNVEWQLKLLFQIFLEFCSEEQLLRVWFVSFFPFQIETELIVPEAKLYFIYWLLISSLWVFKCFHSVCYMFNRLYLWLFLCHVCLHLWLL